MDLYSYIWGTWFLDTKETLDMRDDFELYDERFLGFDNPDSQIDIYIPILWFHLNRAEQHLFSALSLVPDFSNS